MWIMNSNVCVMAAKNEEIEIYSIQPFNLKIEDLDVKVKEKQLDCFIKFEPFVDMWLLKDNQWQSN